MLILFQSETIGGGDCESKHNATQSALDRRLYVLVRHPVEQRPLLAVPCRDVHHDPARRERKKQFCECRSYQRTLVVAALIGLVELFDCASVARPYLTRGVNGLASRAAKDTFAESVNGTAC